MTIFDLIALLITILILVILLFFGIIWKLLDDIKGWQKSVWQELRGIRVNVADTAEYTHNHIAPDVEIISNNFLHLLDENNGTPCYAPDGICTNPYRDCINCPKRGTGGTWSTNTSIKAKDVPLQERFNDNKED